MQKTSILSAGAWLMAAPAFLISAERESGETSFRGVLTAKATSGRRVVEYRYTSIGSKLRLDDTRRTPPTPPYNLIDLKSGDVTILYPQNSTCVIVPAARIQAPGTGQSLIPGMPALPPGIGPQVMPGVQFPAARAASPATGNGAAKAPKAAVPAPPAIELPEGLHLPPGIGPQAKTPADPGKPTKQGTSPVPVFPQLELPKGVKLPPGIGPQATAGGVAIPQMPAMPGGMPGFPGAPGGGLPQMPQMPHIQPHMPAMPGAVGPKTPAELVKTEETKEILGFPCTRYTFTDPREGTLEVWATDRLGPFYLHASSAPRSRSRREFHETWPAHLRAKGLFPLLAVIKEESTETYRFEVTAIEKDVPAPGELFAVPPGFHKTELRDF